MRTVVNKTIDHIAKDNKQCKKKNPNYGKMCASKIIN